MRERLAELDVSQRGGVVVARIVGEIDSSNAIDLRLALIERLSNTTTALVIDLSRVTYIDSPGIQLLFDLGRHLADRRQSLRLVVGEDAPTRRVLDLCQVGEMAPLDSELDAALRALDEA